MKRTVVTIIALLLLIGCVKRANKQQENINEQSYCFFRDGHPAMPLDSIHNSDSEKDTAKLHKLLTENGWKDSQGEYHVYHTENVKQWYNITSPYVLNNTEDIQLFMDDSWNAFLLVGETVYRPFDVFGGWVIALTLCDVNSDGNQEVVAYHSWGSGLSYLSVSYFDVSTGATTEVKRVMTLNGESLDYRFDGNTVYVDGKDIRKLSK